MFDLFADLDRQEEKVREEYIRAPFPYPGSKSKSLDQILPLLPYRKIYCEPFGGSGAVLLSRNESNLEIFNDRYAGVVALYRVVKDPIKLLQLIEKIKLSLHAREEFIWCKQTWENCTDDVERAYRWYYIVNSSFYGKARNFGRVLKSSSQFGKKLQNNIELLYPVHERLKNVQIENLDWWQCIEDYDSEDCVFYFDPPYRTVFKGCYKHELSDIEHRSMLDRIFKMKGFVAISSYEDPMYTSYPWNHKYTWKVDVARGMAITETNKLAGTDYSELPEFREVKECLWIKE